MIAINGGSQKAEKEAADAKQAEEKAAKEKAEALDKE